MLSSFQALLARRRQITTTTPRTMSDTVNESRMTPTHNVTLEEAPVERERRKCWICFGEEGEAGETENRWVKPCHCSLESHEECLLNWINENQKGIPFKKASQ
jgi:hypothetical protein